MPGSARITPAPGRLHAEDVHRPPPLQLPRLDFRSKVGSELFGNLQSTRRLHLSTSRGLASDVASIRSGSSSLSGVDEFGDLISHKRKAYSAAAPSLGSLATARSVAGNLSTSRSVLQQPSLNKGMSISTAISIKTRMRRIRKRKTEIARAVPRIKIVHDDGAERNRFIIPWDSRFRQIWDICAVFFVMYLSFKVPIGVAFDGAWSFPKALDTLMDIYFITDIVLNFRTGFLHNGHHITDPTLIREHYMHSWFWIDLIATIPWEAILKGLMAKSARKSLKMLKWLKFPKLLRLSRFLRYLKSNIKYYQIFVLSIMSVFCIHVLGCMFVATVAQCTDPELVDDHGYSIVYCTSEQMTAYYASGVYAALLMLLNVLDGTQLTQIMQILDSGANMTIDETDLTSRRILSSTTVDETTAETTASNTTLNVVNYPPWRWVSDSDLFHRYVVLYIVCGLIMILGFALIIQMIAEAVMFAHQRSQAFLEFYQKVDRVKREMESHNLPEDVQYRVARFYDYLWMNNRHGQGSSTSGILKDDDLSLPLKKQIALAMHGRLLRQVTIFDGCSEGCIFDIAMRLRFHVYMPGDLIFSSGEVATELYLVREGSVKLIIPVHEARRSMLHDTTPMSRIQEDSTSLVEEEDSPAAPVKEEKDSSLLASKGNDELDDKESKSSKKTNGSTTSIATKLKSQPDKMDNSMENPLRAQDTDLHHDLGITIQDDNIIKVMGRGSYFGELALLTAMPRACDAISSTMTELNELSKHDFHEVMIKFPELSEEIVEEVSAEYPHLREEMSRYCLAASAQAYVNVHGSQPPTMKHGRYFGSGEDVEEDIDTKLRKMEERIMRRMEKILATHAHSAQNHHQHLNTVDE